MAPRVWTAEWHPGFGRRNGTPGLDGERRGRGVGARTEWRRARGGAALLRLLFPGGARGSAPGGGAPGAPRQLMAQRARRVKAPRAGTCFGGGISCRAISANSAWFSPAGWGWRFRALERRWISPSWGGPRGRQVSRLRQRRASEEAGRGGARAAVAVGVEVAEGLFEMLLRHDLPPRTGAVGCAGHAAAARPRRVRHARACRAHAPRPCRRPRAKTPRASAARRGSR
jgi:hypothetical protein